jgi:hypothetical protein
MIFKMYFNRENTPNSVEELRLHYGQPAGLEDDDDDDGSYAGAVGTGDDMDW